MPAIWYFTNAEGVIKRKLKEKLTMENIYKNFTLNIPVSGIVAVFIEINDRDIEFENG